MKMCIAPKAGKPVPCHQCKYRIYKGCATKDDGKKDMGDFGRPDSQ